VNNNLISHLSLKAEIRKINRIYVGSKQGTQEFFAGRIDDLRIYSEVFNNDGIVNLGKEIRIQEVFEDLEKMEKHYQDLLKKRKKREREFLTKQEEEKKRLETVKVKIQSEKEALIEILKKLGEPPIVSVVIKEGREEEALESLRRQKKEKTAKLEKQLSEEKQRRARLLKQIDLKWRELSSVIKELGENIPEKPVAGKRQEERVLSDIMKQLKAKRIQLAKVREAEEEKRRAFRIKIEETKIRLGILREKLGIKEKLVVSAVPGKEEETLASLKSEVERREKELESKLKDERQARRKEFLNKIEEKKKILYDLMAKLNETERPEFKVSEGEEIRVLKEIDLQISRKREEYRKIQEKRQRDIALLRSKFMTSQDKLNDILSSMDQPGSELKFDEKAAEKSVSGIKELLAVKQKELEEKKEKEKSMQEKMHKDRKELARSMEDEKQAVLKLVDALKISSYSFPVEFEVSSEISKEKLIIYYDFNSPTYNTVPNKAIAKYSARLNEIRKENWVGGKFGKAIDLNGINNYISVTGINSSLRDSMTIMFWAYPTRFWGTRTLMIFEGDKALLKIAEEDDKLYLQFQNSYQKKIYDNVVKLKKNKWQHISFSFDSKTKKISVYHDGRPVFERYLEMNFDGKLSRLMIGSDGGKKEFFSGRIDEFRMYNHLLNSKAVAKKMNESKVITPEESLENMKTKLTLLRKEKEKLQKRYQEQQVKMRRERERTLQNIEKERARINDLKEKMGEAPDYRVQIVEGKEKQILVKVKDDRGKYENKYNVFIKNMEERKKKFIVLIEEEKGKIIELKKKLGEVAVYQIDIVEGYEKDIYGKVRQARIKKEEEWNIKVREEKRNQRIADLKNIEKLTNELNSIRKELKEGLYRVPNIQEGQEAEAAKTIMAEVASAKKRLAEKNEKEKLARMKKLEAEKRKSLVSSIREITKSIKDFERELGIVSKETLIQEQAVKDRTLKAYIKFDKSGGFSADDASGYNNTGFIKGTDIYQWEKGKYGNAFSFSGVVGWFEIPTSPALGSLEDLTVMMWVYPKRFFNDRTMFYYATKDNAKYLKLRLKDDRVFIDLVNYREKVNIDTGINLKKGNWQHLGFSYSRKSTHLQIFFNGKLVTDVNTKIKLDLQNQPIVLGSIKDSEFYAGRIDEFKLYNRILSSKEFAKNKGELVVEKQAQYQNMALSKLEKKEAELSSKKDTLQKKVASKREKELKQKEEAGQRQKMLKEQRRILAEKKKKEQELQRQREIEQQKKEEAAAATAAVKTTEPETLTQEERMRQKLAMLKKKMEREQQTGFTEEVEKTSEKDMPIVFHFAFEKLLTGNMVSSENGRSKAELVQLGSENLVESVEGKGVKIVSGGYAKINKAYFKDIEKEMTLSFWLKASSTQADITIIERGAFRGVLNQGILSFSLANHPNKKLEMRIDKDRWYAVAVTFNNFSGDMKLYVNGSLKQAITVDVDISMLKGDLFVGKGANDAVSTFKGIFDELKLFSRELSEEQLAIKMPFNVDIKVAGSTKTDKRTVILKMNADNAYQFMVYETGRKKQARWEKMRPKKIFVLSSGKGKKEIQCIFRSWSGETSAVKIVSVEYKKEEKRVKIYSPQPGSVITGRR